MPYNGTHLSFHYSLQAVWCRACGCLASSVCAARILQGSQIRAESRPHVNVIPHFGASTSQKVLHGCMGTTLYRKADVTGHWQTI